MTVKALCELFDKHENTVYRWILKDHLFPNAFRVKDGWYVPVSDVEKLMKAGRLNGTSKTTHEEQAAKPSRTPLRGGFVTRWRK